MSKNKPDTLMCHSVGGNMQTNAARFTHNSIQGHHHSLFGVVRHADKANLRWHMSVGCTLDPNSPAARYAASAVLKRPILGCGMLLDGRNGNTLVMSDAHIPYHHRDTFDFYWALHQEYNFSQVLNVGDLLDHHAGSYHETEPDAYTPEEEYYKAQKALYELEDMFPEMVITNGNHDKIPQRKLRTVGLPTSMVSDYNKLYDLSGQWQWVDEYYFNAQGAYPVIMPMVLNSRGRWDKRIMRVK